MSDVPVGTRKRRPLTQLSQSNQSTASNKKKRSDDSEKRAGTITRIILKNFMCHSLLDVDLSVNINIIIGKNGSGKSAILTALVVGLGGKASLTNRGTSVKGFIKAGKNSGSVEIQLYNGGAMAYRPNIYGDRITVIRNLTASGSSSYRIKNEKGEVIATQIKEIHNITTSLNIQVDNPVCILNQDTAKNFLSSNNPKHKFILFVKATKLEDLNEEYKKITLNKKESVQIFEEKNLSYKRLQTELRELKAKIDNHRSLGNIRDNLKLVQLELLWAKVRDAELELEKERENVGHWERKKEVVLEECSSRAVRVDSIKEKIRKINQQMSELKETLQVQSRPQNDVKAVIEDLKSQYSNKKKERQLISNVLESRKKDAETLMNEIKNANENLSKAEQQKMKRLRDLNNMNEKIKGTEDHLQTCRNDLHQLTCDIGRRDDERQALRQEIIRVERQINNEKSSLDALKRETGNTLLLYGQDIPRVKQLIEQNKSKFKHLPRGPLGSYIKLKDKKWAVAVEGYLGPALLGAFIVDNGEDNRLLHKILSQNWSSGRQPMIITSKFFFQKHNIDPNLVQAPQDCCALYSVLEIQDPVVSNCLVDQSSVESILLAPSNERAMQLLSRADRVPRNCSQAVTIKGDRYYPDPNYRTYGSRYHRAQYLQVDTKEHIIQLEHNMGELIQKKKNLENELSAICKDLREQETKKKQLEENIRKLNAAKLQIRARLDELKATAEPEVANVEFLESELKDVVAIMKEKKAEFIQVEEALAEIKTKITENEEKLQQLKDANTSLQDRMRSLESQVNEEKIRQREIETGEQFDRRKVKEFDKKLIEAEAQLSEKQAAVKRYTNQASSIGERQVTERNVAEIVTEIGQLEASITRMEISTEDVDALYEKYETMNNKFNNLSKILKRLNSDIKELTSAMEKRSRHYRLLEDYFINFIQHAFKKIMEVRQFQGSVDINMREKKLELIVIPQHGSQGVTTTSNLSGGERSFSTVAFLYALWQCMEFPFYFLDEFDVYMDKLNRSKVFDILLHHAESNPALQFVFLTPQDISFVKKNISILRLEDPERNQV